MKKNHGRVAWVCLAAFLMGGTVARAVPSELLKFETWAEKYLSLPSEKREWMEKEGLDLARARRPVMLDLIRTDPATALEWALSRNALDEMPDGIREELEYWVNDRASTSLFSAGPLPEQWENSREWLIHGQVMRVYVYGRRRLQHTIWDRPVFGVGMGNELAAAEESIEILKEADAKDPTIHAGVGGDVIMFSSEKELQAYAQELRAAEQADMDREGKELAGQPNRYSTSVELDYADEALRLVKAGGYGVAILDGMEERAGNPGEPSLPCQTIYVPIPAGAVATQVTATADSKTVGSGVVLLPVQSARALTADPPKDRTPPDAAIYTSSRIWPPVPYEKVRTTRIRGRSFVAIQVLPVRYVPAKGEVVLAQSLKVKIDCAWPKARPSMVEGGGWIFTGDWHTSGWSRKRRSRILKPGPCRPQRLWVSTIAGYAATI